MPQHLDTDDMLFHSLIVGETGSGKTNSVLYILDPLFKKKVEGTAQPSLFLFDPAGDASIDLFRSIPASEWSRVAILDPQYVSFGFNPLSLPENLDPADEVVDRNGRLMALSCAIELASCEDLSRRIAKAIRDEAGALCDAYSDWCSYLLHGMEDSISR
jgi:hypothetical protein